MSKTTDKTSHAAPSGPLAGMADVRDEQQALARLTVDLDCSQQKFFQAEYGRHRRSPTAALLLCLLLGDFGAHEFYFGRMTSGLLRLLFSWTFIPWLIALVEAPHVPAYARRYNAELAQGIVDMLHEVRAHVRALDPAPAPTAGAATVVVAPAVAPIILRPDDERLIRAASNEAPDDAAADTRGAPHIPYAALLGGGSLAAISAVAAAAVGYHHASDHAAQADAPNAPDAPDAPDASAGDHASAPPAPPVAAAWDDTPVEQTAPAAHASDHAAADTAIAAAAVPVFAYSLGTARRAPVRYGPPLDDATNADGQAPSAQQPTPPPPAPPVRTRRIVVRKVVLVDGKQVAEAIATRVVPLDNPTSPLSLDERIQRATEDARDEALRLLAERVTADVRADAAQQFGDHV